MSKFSYAIFSLLSVLLAGCSNESAEEVNKATAAPAISNRLHVPPEVISNLGITFAVVKRGKVGEWREVAGHLEVPSEQRYILRAPARGRVKALAPLWSGVKKGEMVAELVSPQLLLQQHALVTAFNVLQAARREAQGGSQAQLRTAQVERAYRQELNNFSVITGISPEDLAIEQGGNPRWLKMSSLIVASPDDGSVVEIETSVGEVVEEGARLAIIYNLNNLRFKGRLPETYLGQLRVTNKMRIRPVGTDHVIESSVERILPVIDEDSKSVLVEASIDNSEFKLPHGISASAQLLVTGGEYEEAVVPADCVVQDGLEMILFKRDTEKPEYVVRTPIEIGGRSGEMVEALSGVMEGDEVVCKGIHQLKLTGLGKAPQGGHFHADGTWHEGDK